MNIQGIHSPLYKAWQESRGLGGRTNGAYHYAKEIEENILPHIESNCYINTVGALLYSGQQIPDGAVIVTHDNHGTADKYRHLFKRGMIFVCSKRSTAKSLTVHGEKAVYIPLSIDVEYVKQFRYGGKKKGAVFFGNQWGFKKQFLDSLEQQGNIAFISDMERDDCLRLLARSEKAYAEGRCAMEAEVLGVEVELPRYDSHRAEMPPLYDNRDVIGQWRDVLVHAKQYKMIQMNADIYPHCKGDKVRVDEEKLSWLEKTALSRRLEQAFTVL